MRKLPKFQKPDLAGRRVLVRADLNVPMKGPEITDATRIERFLPTISKLTSDDASVVILTHLGRPEGKPNPSLSTAPVAKKIQELLGQDTLFVPDCVGVVAEKAVSGLKPGDVAVLENLRFHSGETNNSSSFATRLSVLGDIYINDAFSCSHRAHASTDALAKIMPAYAGPSLLAEVAALQTALETPVRPAAALVGGAKVSTKISVLKNLIPKTDYLIVGGGMANTFLAAMNHNMGKSLYEPQAVQTANEIMRLAKEQQCEIVLPDDLVVASEFAENAKSTVVDANDIPANMIALDIGPKSQKRIIATLQKCKTLLWNGPLGAFEIVPFGSATFSVARVAAELTGAGKLITVAGGGDTVSALNLAGATERFSYVSTAGGAFLEWLEGKDLPGIEALLSKQTDKQEAC